MESFWNKRFFTWIVYTLLVLAGLYLLVALKPMISWIFGFTKAVFAPFLIAMIISYVLNPVVNMLNDRKVPRTIAVLLIYAMFVASVVVVLMNLVPMLIAQLRELNEHVPGLTFRAQSLINGVSDNPLVPEGIRTGFDKALTHVENRLNAAIGDLIQGIGSTLNVLFVAFIVPFLAFYMMKDFQLIEKTVLAIVPREHRKQTVKLVVDIDEALGNYVRGQILVCLIVGILAYIGYWIIGMPYALLLASVVALFNIIPYLGPFFGAAPAMLVAATISIKMMLLVAAVNLICQVLEGNVISPQVVGRSLHLHPLVIIFALLVGGELAGIVGMILAVPFFAVIKVIAHHVANHYIHRKTT
ncbi:AI-2E family transporter [Paenibacillus thermoaerophilus]|uniref:AI-2E family transporter n=1 Tax=Paenibacillus thermoaerophilus TaxID=1215385 RepID=A0ABW2V1G9_9BACL|nr:AI-2E family transporter [Paenibacillus thermoaerophilus]TMV17338.1 AI-2E family transporter [Paenibacillus thermoaerophilus]